MQTDPLTSELIPLLIHLQTNTPIVLPNKYSVIHLGKPNNVLPPDVDLSAFPHSENVSRMHADILIEGNDYFIEDSHSGNGTYLNQIKLMPGRRYRLATGDRIDLGKENKLTFLFRLSEKAPDRPKKRPNAAIIRACLLIGGLLVTGLPIVALLAMARHLPTSQNFTYRSPDEDPALTTNLNSLTQPPDGSQPFANTSADTIEQVGQTFRIQDLSFTVQEFKFLGKSVGSRYLKKDAFGSWVLLALDVQNLGSSTTNPASLSSTRFALQDTNGNNYSADIEGTVFYEKEIGAQGTHFTQLAPQASSRIYLLFDVTSGANQFQIQIAPDPLRSFR